MDDDEIDLFDDNADGFDPFADITENNINEATLIGDDDLSELIGALR